MNAPHSDALVFFGATGDLAYKKIFPSLQAMVKRGNLNVPVIGVAKAGWNLDQLKARAKDSLEKHGGLDPAAFEKLSGLLRYVDGDYNDPATFQALRKELGAGATPGLLSGHSAGRVRHRRGATWPRPAAPRTRRVIIEKPFGRDLASAAGAQPDPAQDLRRETRFSALTIISERSPCITCCSSALPTRCWNRSGTVNTSRVCRSRWRRISACRAAARFYDQVGTIRDVMQNHLFQVLAHLAMEPPVRTDSESIRDEKVKVLKAIPPLKPKNLVRGQFRGYQQEPGVAPGFARWKPLRRSSWRLIPGAGAAFRFTSAPGKICRSPARKCWSGCASRRRCIKVTT